MKTIKAESYQDIPRHFTGIAEYADGTKEWFLNGNRHRADGPAIEWADGGKAWYLNGNHHRADGPAIECDGTKQWWLYDNRHRVDGPAWEGADGTKEWYLNGKFVYQLEPLGEYIVIEEGLPSTMKWLGKPVSTLKVLTTNGIQFIPNLPGIKP